MDAFNVKGTIQVINNDTGETIARASNMFLDAGKQHLLNCLTGNTTSADGYSYFVMGDGTTKTSANDTKLANELFRKYISQTTIIQNRLLISIFLELGEANLLDAEGNPRAWKEIGIYAGGSGDKDTGMLYNRANIDLTKTGAESLTILWYIDIN